MKGVTTVKTDVSTRTVTVTFENQEAKLEDIVKALNVAGYTVGEPKVVEAVKP